VARLRLAVACIGLGFASPVAAHPVDRWRALISEASARFGIPKAWIARVMRAESGGRPYATSHRGAMGLMQLMPATWAEMRAAEHLGSDPYLPSDNILAGTAYLRLLYDRFGYPGLFAAYNAGPRRYSEYLAGRPLPVETVAYLSAVAGSTGAAEARSVRQEQRSPLVPVSGASLFVPLRTAR
jgi:soluble lytic murein transglycosylase-like protein